MNLPIGHERVLAELRALAASPSPPHALLFAGPEGTGRTLLAVTYAQLLNCRGDGGERPCGVCRPCRLIAGPGHPDVMHVGPGDTLCRPRPDSSHPPHPISRDIRICQVRGIIDAVSRYPVEAAVRAIIVEPAHTITNDAAQALLKTLEEPPGNAVLLLVTSAPERLPETVLSRCRRIDVHLVAQAAIEAGLRERGHDEATARRAAAHAAGRPARAIAYAKNPALIEAVEARLRHCGEVAAGSIATRFEYARSVGEQWRAGRAAVYEELAAWETAWSNRLGAAAAGGDQARALGAVQALKAIQAARIDLEANVQARAAIELMLLRFPAGTMDLVAAHTGAAARAGD